MSSTWLRTIRLTATADQLGDALAGHREQVEAWRREGRLRYAAAFADGAGFVEAFEAPDRHGAERLAAGSPLVARGLGAWSLQRLEED